MGYVHFVYSVRKYISAHLFQHFPFKLKMKWSVRRILPCKTKQRFNILYSRDFCHNFSVSSFHCVRDSNTLKRFWLQNQDGDYAFNIFWRCWCKMHSFISSFIFLMMISLSSTYICRETTWVAVKLDNNL